MNKEGELTGTWQCNYGGTFYFRQVGEMIFWEGAHQEKKWSNVGCGKDFTLFALTDGIVKFDLRNGKQKRINIIV